MPDNWGFVAAAYALAAAVFGGYWRWLHGKERELQALHRSHPPSRSAHPRAEPASRHPLQ
jgi:hypothetical protein